VGVSPLRPEGILPSVASSSSSSSSAAAALKIGEEAEQKEETRGRDAHGTQGRDALATTERGDSPYFPATVSGVLGSSDPDRTARQLRLMRWFGLRDFKLKVGLAPDVDAENLRVVGRKIGTAVRRGKCTLRVDANSAWPADAVPEHTAELAAHGVCVVEQPADVSAEEMVELAHKCKLPLMADESLLTPRDAAVLLKEPRIWWSIRISKNGGLLPALQLCRQAAEAGVTFVCGCLVGETGILSAFQRRLLVLAPRPRFVEGNYGRFLLSDDLTRPSLRFGYGGRLRRLTGTGLGVAVDENKLHRYGKLVKTLTA
jgi:muconate cycloisomerase